MGQNQELPALTPVYRSGAVAKLTGIPVETLRVWERRYKVVGPRQSASGQRQYSPQDVTRLGVIKQLVDVGYAIGSIAALDQEQLRSMLHNALHPALSTLRQSTSEAGGPRLPLRVAVIGEALALRVERRRLPALQVVATSPDAARAIEQLRGVEANVLLIELPTLNRETPQQVRALAQQLGAQRIVMAYGFGPKHIEEELRAFGSHLVRAPLDIDQLESLCGAHRTNALAGDSSPRAHADSAPRRFDNKALAEVALSPVKLNCECPHHLADLLVRLGNFETYSAECESRSPADAVLHHYVKQTTGSARALLEEALARVLEAEGLALYEQKP